MNTRTGNCKSELKNQYQKTRIHKEPENQNTHRTGKTSIKALKKIRRQVPEKLVGEYGKRRSRKDGHHKDQKARRPRRGI